MLLAFLVCSDRYETKPFHETDFMVRDVNKRNWLLRHPSTIPAHGIDEVWPRPASSDLGIHQCITSKRLIVETIK
jgi:hypothetical protein